jgi:hypothetical protein
LVGVGGGDHRPGRGGSRYAFDHGVLNPSCDGLLRGLLAIDESKADFFLQNKVTLDDEDLLDHRDDEDVALLSGLRSLRYPLIQRYPLDLGAARAEGFADDLLDPSRSRPPAC